MVPAPLVVVGAGVAGLCLALSAAPRRVLLISRGSGDGATSLAQGGIAAALAAGDHPGRHAADTLAAGAAHNDIAAVRRLVHAAPGAIRWLAAQGVPFDRDEKGGWQLGREGGHDCARIVHAGGDASGRELVAALLRAAAGASHIERCEGWMLEALNLQAGAVSGLRLRGCRGQGMREIEATDVVLATGGIGALFAATTNPPGADGAGLALALVAGAAARDLEFLQFHPTALDVPGMSPLPLVTEALRGAGAVLLDEAGTRLMPGVHPLADLAPRDGVAAVPDGAFVMPGTWCRSVHATDTGDAGGTFPHGRYRGGRVRAQHAARSLCRRRGGLQRRARRQPPGQQFPARRRGVGAPPRRVPA